MHACLHASEQGHPVDSTTHKLASTSMQNMLGVSKRTPGSCRPCQGRAAVLPAPQKHS